jgi:hypothetical protein
LGGRIEYFLAPILVLVTNGIAETREEKHGDHIRTIRESDVFGVFCAGVPWETDFMFFIKATCIKKDSLVQ